MVLAQKMLERRLPRKLCCSATGVPRQHSPVNLGRMSDELSVFKTKLAAFYRQHNPEKLISLDALVKAYANKQAEMDTIMKKKYGVGLKSVRTFDVTVFTLAGDTYEVALVDGMGVQRLKEEISHRQGVWTHLQQIFMKPPDDDAGQLDEKFVLKQKPLSDSQVFSGACEVLLYVLSNPIWSWSLIHQESKTSSKKCGKKMRISRIFDTGGKDGCIATKIEREQNKDPWANCLMCEPAMPSNSGKHSISLHKFSRYSCALGVVKQGASPFKCHALDYDSSMGFFMFTGN